MFKQKLKLVLAAGVVGASLASGASAFATTLTGTLTADNGFFAYLGQDPNSLGTLIASGNNWRSPVTITPTQLAPGANYLNIEVVNYGAGGGLLGSFSYGGTTLLTNTTQWTAAYNSSYAGIPVGTILPQTWVPTNGGSVINYNGDTSSSLWYGTSFSSTITPSAEWIDSATYGTSLNTCPNGYCTVDFTAEIMGAPGPIPGAGFASLAFLILAGLTARARSFLAR